MSQSETKTQQPLTSKWLFWVLVAVFVVATAVAAFFVFTTVRRLTVTTGSVMEGVPVEQLDESGNVIPASETSGTPAPVKQIAPKPKQWDGASRVTILAMGLDYRDWESGEIPRTDTMILVTIDPISNTAGMINIPRDMWVEIPNFGHAKINTAYYLGEANKLPGGGPALAIQTVEQFIGVPINYYAQIDFKTFVDLIDILQGIEIDVPAEIKVDPLGKGNTVTVPAGKQTMLGEVALAYARARYTEGSDFDRARRQQQVIMAIRDKMVKPGVMSWLIKNSADIYAKLGEGVHTNLTPEQVIALGLLARKVPAENIHASIIGTDMVGLGKSPDGLDVIRPVPDKIRELRDSIFTSVGAVAPSIVSSDVSQLMHAESSRLGVQSGTQDPGLAARTSEYLKSLNFNVVDVSTAGQYYPSSTIVDYTGKPYTVQYLATLMNIPQNRIMNRFDPGSSVDVHIIVGDDWAVNNTMP